METQPQLLLLQKTMVMAEGMGRALNPSLNMWQLAQPLVEEWMATNLGPQAQLRDAVEEGLETARRLPQMVENAEQLLQAAVERGVKLHPSSVAALNHGHSGRTRLLPWALCLILGGALVVALLR